MLAGCLLACLPACTAICECRSGSPPIDHPIRSALCCLLSALPICQSALPPCLCTHWLLAPMWNEMHTLPDAARECSSPSCTSSPTCTVLPYPSSDCVTLRPRCRHTPSRTSNALFRTYAWRPLCNLHSFSDVQAGGLHLAAVSGPSLCSSSNSNTTRRQPSERDIRPDSAMYIISIF